LEKRKSVRQSVEKEAKIASRSLQEAIELRQNQVMRRLAKERE